MSIQSSVNALIGSIAAVRKSHDFTKHREAMLRVEETKAAASLSRAQAMQADVARMSTPEYQKAQLERSRALKKKEINQSKLIKMGVTQDGKQ